MNSGRNDRKKDTLNQLGKYNIRTSINCIDLVLILLFIENVNLCHFLFACQKETTKIPVPFEVYGQVHVWIC